MVFKLFFVLVMLWRLKDAHAFCLDCVVVSCNCARIEHSFSPLAPSLPSEPLRATTTTKFHRRTKTQQLVKDNNIYFAKGEITKAIEQGSRQARSDAGLVRKSVLGAAQDDGIKWKNWQRKPEQEGIRNFILPSSSESNYVCRGHNTFRGSHVVEQEEVEWQWEISLGWRQGAHGFNKDFGDITVHFETGTRKGANGLRGAIEAEANYVNLDFNDPLNNLYGWEFG